MTPILGTIEICKLMFYLLSHRSQAPLLFRQISSRSGLGQANHNSLSNTGRF